MPALLSLAASALTGGQDPHQPIRSCSQVVGDISESLLGSDLITSSSIRDPPPTPSRFLQEHQIRPSPRQEGQYVRNMSLIALAGQACFRFWPADDLVVLASWRFSASVIHPTRRARPTMTSMWHARALIGLVRSLSSYQRQKGSISNTRARCACQLDQGTHSAAINNCLKSHTPPRALPPRPLIVRFLPCTTETYSRFQ